LVFIAVITGLRFSKVLKICLIKAVRSLTIPPKGWCGQLLTVLKILLLLFTNKKLLEYYFSGKILKLSKEASSSL